MVSSHGHNVVAFWTHSCHFLQPLCRYTHAGIDDGWQLCNSGPDGKGFHNASGFPLVDTTRFPDVKGMTALASSLGLVPGWYSNNWWEARRYVLDQRPWLPRLSSPR